MAASLETQRLISVSLGKIAQSRGQRGGINLHKNLLVATVLHKARTAYMVESYTFQQAVHQRQKLQQQHQQTSQDILPASESSPTNELDKGEPSAPSTDSEVGQPLASTPTPGEQSVSSSRTSGSGEPGIPEPPHAAETMEMEVSHDKENSPPSCHDRLNFSDNEITSKIPEDSHLSTKNQRQDIHITVITRATKVHKPKSKVLKRRRSIKGCASSDIDCPASKKAKVCEDSCSSSSFYSDSSDASSDESDVELEAADSTQISNLVNIFNSGFSGLCAVSSCGSGADSQSCANTRAGFGSDSPSFSLKTKLLSESATSSFSRMMSEPSLLCSTEVSRLESLPSAIVLSA